MIKILASDGKARRGKVSTAHGEFNTPAFMPVGTQATVKGVNPAELEALGAEVILSNTYHLFLRPGDELIANLGGLHRFMNWSGPILTDSGGFQVFSLSKLRKLEEGGVRFQSHLDGEEHFFSPEKVIDIQRNLGVDIMMILDECLAYPASQEDTLKSLKLTTSWARSAKEYSAKVLDSKQKVFGIVQGGFYKELREQSARELVELDFDGYAIGGLSVGEPEELLAEFSAFSAELLPLDKPRYLMGVGYPSDIVHAVKQGFDLFDCVIPTRSARFGRVFVPQGFLNLRNQYLKTSSEPIDQDCGCYTCSSFSRAYLSHLFRAKEILGVQLATIHNLFFYQSLMKSIRDSVEGNYFEEFATDFRWRKEKES